MRRQSLHVVLATWIMAASVQAGPVVRVPRQILNPGDVLEAIEEDPRPRPFKYSYSAGRAPNSKPDRYVEQEGDEDGVIRGTYTYLDPNWTWQTIKYEADPEGGFRIMEGSTLATVKDTEAVARAKAEHAALFANIAAAHQSASPVNPVVPEESAAVQQKRDEQEILFQQIAEQHRQIAEEHRRIAERTALAESLRPDRPYF